MSVIADWNSRRPLSRDSGVEVLHVHEHTEAILPGRIVHYAPEPETGPDLAPRVTEDCAHLFTLSRLPLPPHPDGHQPRLWSCSTIHSEYGTITTMIHHYHLVDGRYMPITGPLPHLDAVCLWPGMAPHLHPTSPELLMVPPQSLRDPVCAELVESLLPDYRRLPSVHIWPVYRRRSRLKSAASRPPTSD